MLASRLPRPANAQRLFTQLHTYSRRDADVVENFLTECFAAALTEDQVFAKAAVAQLVGGRSIASVEIRSATVTAYTQVHIARGAILDVLVEVASPDRRRVARIALENKLEAGLGLRQLSKYLRQPMLDGVALVGRHVLPIPQVVLHHHKYLRPRRRTHFLWPDLHPFIERRAKTPGAPALTRSLAGLYQFLRFEPPPKAIGDLRHREDRPLRRSFARRWDETKAALAKLGWETGAGSIAQLYINRTRGSGRLWWVLADPLAPDHCLRVRLNFDSERTLKQVQRELQTSRFPFRRDTFIKVRTVRRADDKAFPVLDLEVPLRTLFPPGTEKAGHGGHLARYVLGIIRRADHRKAGR